MQPLGQALRTRFIVYWEPVDSRSRLCTHSSEGKGFKHSRGLCLLAGSVLWRVSRSVCLGKLQA